MNENKKTANESISATLNLYKQITETRERQASAKKVDLRNYFTPSSVLPKGVNTKDVRIRILPPHPGEPAPFSMVKFHNVKVNGRYRKLYDPAQEGKRSPLNEMRQLLLTSDDKEERRMAINYRSADYFICRIIQRDKETDGIKYFRFRSTDNGEGFMDKIVPYLQRGYDLFDPNTGCDVTLSLKRNDRDQVKITTVIVEQPCRISDNDAQQEQWLADQSTWEDVYKKYEADYLEIIAKGDEPIWDKDKNCYIPKEEYDEKRNSEGSVSMNGPANNNADGQEIGESTESEISDNDPDDIGDNTMYSTPIDDDDLPF